VISDLVARIVEGLTTPRVSLRSFLERGPHGISVVGALILMSYLVQALSAVLIPGVETTREGGAFPWHVAGLTLQVILFAISAAAVFGLRQPFGRVAQVWDVVLAMAWYGFLTSFLAPLAQLGAAAAVEGRGGAGATLLFLASAAIGLWVLAGFVAEVHGFRSTGSVLGVMVGLMLLSSFALAPLLGAA